VGGIYFILEVILNEKIDSEIRSMCCIILVDCA